MQMERTLILSDDDIFQMIKGYVNDRVNGCNSSDVCNYKVQFIEKDGKSPRPEMRVTLRNLNDEDF